MMGDRRPRKITAGPTLHANPGYHVPILGGKRRPRAQPRIEAASTLYRLAPKGHIGSLYDAARNRPAGRKTYFLLRLVNRQWIIVAVVKQNPSAGKAERGILKDPAILIDKIRLNVAIVIREDQDLAAGRLSAGITGARQPRDRFARNLHAHPRALGETPQGLRGIVGRPVVDDHQLPRCLSPDQPDGLE